MLKPIAFAALSAFVVACGGGEPPAAPVTETVPVPPPESAPVDLPPADAGAPTAAPTPADPALSDEQIAKVVWTLDQGEIDAGKMAATNGKDAKVKKFAAMMVKHHTEDQKKGEAWAKKAKVTPGDSPVAADLAKQNESTGSTLKGLKGADFDKAYIDAQVKGHQDALDLFDKKLLVNAQNADLKAALTAFRPVVETHLKEAKEIQAGLK